MPKAFFRRFLLPITAATLLISGCSADEDVQMPDDEAHASVAPAPTAVQAAVQRGADRAYSLGFMNAQAATAQELAQLRDTQVPEADSVHPEQCTQALNAINTSPVQLSEDAARVDFGSEGYTGTGTVESAVLGQTAATEWMEDYTAAVAQLTGDCSHVEMVLGGETFYFESTSVATEADQALNWKRTPKVVSPGDAEQGTLHSQVLVTQQGGTVHLVSFIGAQPSTSDEFTQIGEQILTSMTTEDEEPND